MPSAEAGLPRRLDRSLFLTAPLAKVAGGTGKCRKGVYQGKDDADYTAVLELVTQAVRKAWHRPRRRDLRALQAPAAEPTVDASRSK